MRAIFIGGPWDGRLVEHELKRPTFRVVERIDTGINYGAQLTGESSTREVIYVNVLMFGFTFMIEEGMYQRETHLHRRQPGQVVLSLLSQGYRRPSDIYGEL